VSQRDKFDFVKCPKCRKWIVSDTLLYNKECVFCHTSRDDLIDLALRQQQRNAWWVVIGILALCTLLIYLGLGG